MVTQIKEGKRERGDEINHQFNINLILQGMGAGSFMFLPGGWAGEEEDVPLVYVLERRNAATYAFYVCNTTNTATQYHPVFFDSNECGIP